MDNIFRVGVDVGSTTMKIVMLDKNNNIVFKHYTRHFSNITATFKTLVNAAHTAMPQKLLSIIFTGSAGIGLAERLNIAFVQEVIACTKAIRTFIPQTNTAIELGGEDAKITYFNGTIEQRMNGVCAGGTGAFIDHMATLLNTDTTGLNTLAKQANNIYPIASRCGVFAKTDVQALMNEGVSKADIAASVLQAVVNQTICSLAQGRPIRGNIALLGGPLYFLSELRNSFVKSLNLTSEQIISPENSQYFVAIGAALSANDTPVFSGDLYKRIVTLHDLTANLNFSDRTSPLFTNSEQLHQFQLRHAKHAVIKQALATYTGNAYLGIDAGSTTTKLVLIGEDNCLLHSYYNSNQGNPIKTVISALKDLYQILPNNIKIIGSGVTGYGERLIQAALQTDIGEVETVAHLKAASCFLPGVNFVLDIGGQDMKCFFVRDGIIDSIMLNEACSSGCGSFIETFAHSLQMNVHDFAQLALTAKNPVDLGSRCTVFMNSKVKQAQKEGASIGEISAGLAISVIKNALFKVIRLKNVADLGEKIIVQGGTFYNDAVLRAMEKIIDREVIRPDIAGLMGAYGAALLAKERCCNQTISHILNAQEIAKFTITTTAKRCKLCGNHCLITIQHFSNGHDYYAGNRCERGANQKHSASTIPSLYTFKYNRLFKYTPLNKSAIRGSIGIPRVLNMYEDYPFWFTFFTALGYRVLISSKSSTKLYELGLETIPSETVCYPAKLVHGHIIDLINKGVKKIFYPCILYNADYSISTKQFYNCPVVASYPEVINANIDSLKLNNITFYHPFLPIDNPQRLAKRLYDELIAENITKGEIQDALEKAYAEHAAYKAAVREEGEKVLNYIITHDGKGIVLAGRPYHIDPEINHGLPELIQSFGLPILSEDSIEHLQINPTKLRTIDQWLYHSRLYKAAALIGNDQYYQKLELIQLNSFGCGLDAITIEQVKEILSTYKKIYTLIKLDEISNLGATRIRIRSLLATIENRKQIPSTITPILDKSNDNIEFTTSMKHTHTILAPQMSPLHFQFVTTSLQKAGYKVIIPNVPTNLCRDEGLKYVNNDACYPAILVVGQMISALKSGKFDLRNTSIMLAQTGGGCRASNYIALMRKALHDTGMSYIPIVSLWGEKSSGFSLTIRLLNNLIMGILYGDLLMHVLHHVRPYEKVAGAANSLYSHWVERCKKDLLTGNRVSFKNNIKEIVKDFDNLAIDATVPKPKVGLVGEILVKYNPAANNNIVNILEREQAEVIVPNLMNFFLYCAYDKITNYDLLAGTWFDKTKAKLFIKILELYRNNIKHELVNSMRFKAPHGIDYLANLAKQHLSLGNITGEGWLLTAEIVALLRSGVKNIICVQPFGCLPNHVVAKGMFKTLREHYPEANIISLDYDSATSEVNQLNRIKLMLSVAKEVNS